MKRVMSYLRDRFHFEYLKDQRGVETLEWIAVALLIVLLALAVYPGTLGTTINGVITEIGVQLGVGS